MLCIRTVSRVHAVGGPSSPATSAVGARSVERVAALVGLVAFLSVASSGPASILGRAVAHPNLAELFVNLETLEAQLLHFLEACGADGKKKAR